MLTFDAGTPERYYETVQISDTGVQSAQKGMRYRDGKPSTYMEEFDVVEGKIADFKRKVTSQSGAWTEIRQSSPAA